MLTLPVRDNPDIYETGPQVDIYTDEDRVHYLLDATADMQVFDITVTHCLPTQSEGLPVLAEGWTYQSFKILESTKGFIRLGVSAY